MMGNYYLMNRRHRWAAVCISKNACTALKAEVLRSEGIDCEGKEEIHDLVGYETGSPYLHPVSAGRPLGFHCFAVWRDPVERFTSAYRHFALDLNGGRLGQIGPDPAEWLGYAELELSKSISFQDEHLRRQSDYYGLSQVDEIIPIDQLNEWFLNRGWGILPHVNASQSQFAFGAGQQAKIRQLYAPDYEIPLLHRSPKSAGQLDYLRSVPRASLPALAPEIRVSRKGATLKLCSAALAYPRMELPFIGEWLDYHLSLGVEHVFLGLHLNEEFQPRESLIPGKRPFPSLYQLDASEGDVLTEFAQAVIPFKKRITTWLFPRRNSEVHGECGEQCDLYRRVMEGYSSDIGWLAVHDIDEFLVPSQQATLTAIIDGQNDEVAGIRMRQVVCEARWTDDRVPRSEPVLSLKRRIAIPMPASHGAKMITRLAAAKEIGVHGSIVEGCIRDDDSLLVYHYRGIPSRTEVTGYRLPVPVEDFDTTDDRPWELLRATKASRILPGSIYP